MITFDKVNKSFKEDFWKAPKKVLDNLSFELSSGSMTGFLGANGAGKTTSIKSLLGFIKLDSGEIRFSSSLGSSFKQVRSRIGYFPEGPYFYSYMSGREFCHYLGSLQGVSNRDVSQQIKLWGQKLNIEYALDNKIRSYSKGMLQRLGFLSSLLHDPELIILDEPLSGLDPIGRKEFKDALLELNQSGKTVFFSSHIVSDVEEICNELVVIQKGKLLYAGNTEELLSESTETDYQGLLRGKGSELFKSTSYDVVKLEADLMRVSFRESEREEFLKIVFESDLNLVELNRERPSLEDVIYRSQSTEGLQ